MQKALLAALLMAVLFSSAWADDELAQGRILVADRQLKDPSFERTVVYLITYDEKGAVGLILNRETDTPVGKILSGVKGGTDRKDFAFSGGPVETDSILALYRGSAKRKGAQQVSPEISAILDEGALTDALAADAGHDALRFYLGYAGWGPGQLEAEIDAGGWYVTGADTATVFDADPDTLWDRLIRRKDRQVVKDDRSPGCSAAFVQHVRFVTLHKQPRAWNQVASGTRNCRERPGFSQISAIALSE